MSWLFDCMCELAVADQLTVIIAADTATPREEDDVVSLAEVIRRASEIPQTTIWVIPAQHATVTTSVDAGECIDLAALSESSALAEIEQLLERQRGSAGTVVRANLGTITLHNEPCAHRQLDALVRSTDIHHRRLFATDALGQSEIFRSLSTRDLGIAIGAVEPTASIAVDDISGVNSIVDALVTLRYFAFGMNDVHEETAARRDLDRLKLSALDDPTLTPGRGDAEIGRTTDRDRVA